jgi:hypothetical protein
MLLILFPNHVKQLENFLAVFFKEFRNFLVTILAFYDQVDVRESFRN